MGSKNAAKLTKRVVDALGPISGRDYSVWDTEVVGFGVRVKPSGAKSFQLKYRNSRGDQRKKTIGKFGSITVDHAKKLARIELGKVAAGSDPVETAKQERKELTVCELCDRYLAEAEAGRILHRNRPKKPSTLAVDKGRIDAHVKPLLGRRRISELRRRDVEKFMYDVRDGKTAADVKLGPRRRSIIKGGDHVAAKSVNLLSTIYKYAIKNGYAEENPCLNIDKPADGKRTRFLKAKEFETIGAALIRAKELGVSPILRDAAIAMMLTGCRRGEILNLTWPEVDEPGRCLNLTDTKTGPQSRPCGHTAFAHFQSLRYPSAHDWVFPSPVNDGPLTEIRKFLAWVMKETDVNDVTPHVFRHSYATVAFELGYSELIIAGLLGHRLSSVTSRYAHQVDHVLADAADRVSKEIAKRLGLQLDELEQGAHAASPANEQAPRLSTASSVH